MVGLGLEAYHTGSNDVVDNQDLLAGLDGIVLHLEEVLAVLLLVANGLTGTGELALLAHGNEAGTETEGQARAHEETTGFETDDHIGLLATVVLENVELKGADEGLVQGVVGEDGHDILEQNSRGGEVRELAQASAQLYLKTGEFGGAGGIGGGESDLGGIWKGGGGHDGKKGRGGGGWVEEVKKTKKTKKKEGGENGKITLG